MPFTASPRLRACRGQTTTSTGATLYSLAGNRALKGGAGDDVLIGAPNDQLSGGPGSNRFVFNPKCGKETITDFNIDQDLMAFDHRLFPNATPSQVISQTHDSKAGAVIVVDT